MEVTLLLQLVYTISFAHCQRLTPAVFKSTQMQKGLRSPDFPGPPPARAAPAGDGGHRTRCTRYVTTSVSFETGPVSLRAGAWGSRSGCRRASRGHGAGAGAPGAGGWASPKVAISRVLPLAVQRGGGGQGAPVAEGGGGGGGGGVQAVAVHARRAPQAALCGAECFG